MLNVITTCPLLTPVRVVSPRFSTWSSTFPHVYYPSKHLDFIVVFESSPLCRCAPLFFSCYPSDLDSTLTSVLHNAPQHIFSLMTTNLLTLNISKTKHGMCEEALQQVFRSIIISVINILHFIFRYF